MKMNIRTFKYRYCWPLFCTVACLFCFVILKKDHHRVVTPDSPASPFQSLPFVLSSRPPIDNPSLTVPGPFQENFTCSVNDSTVIIPSHLPQLHQEFLRYRHCRAFPALLSPSPCEDDLYLLLAIKSTATQVERRAALRDTWGHAGRIQGRRVKLVFLMGRSHDKVESYKLQPLLEWESRRYADIMQWDFADSFFNLTLKEVRFLSWFSGSCSSAQFVFKGDDDVFVHTENLLEFLKAYKPENHLFTGDVLPHSFPIRHSDSKYFIPVEMYPNDKPYPPYVGGGGYLMSRRTVLGLNVAAQNIELFPIDDVFVGMCLQQMDIVPTHHRGILTFGFKNGLNHFDPCFFRDILLVHKLNPTQMWVMWALMLDSNLPCGRSRKTL
ncbi:N-acetyllactosaminide beta-1,3-N-acetylglucosaminyltransferase 4-like isoform X1 [Alosa sapidissima]|uniref:N-acetyllactosaminide beta-1,3-N-acetylglucosaminyltransferase 4-like isoform X1 n=1 Tax=Alosa sapidissima TaxID=34773 RepID=UPI001C09C837|nr:N-acetyllactosaminide beta-1,3-N-acetylglucosaminyltransferase 4-like isoform X1 [Alosa sapidissima]